MSGGHSYVTLYLYIYSKVRGQSSCRFSCKVERVFFNIISIVVCSIPAQAVQENISALLSLLRESVQLNLAPPGHFLLLGSVFTDGKLICILKYDDVRVPV